MKSSFQRPRSRAVAPESGLSIIRAGKNRFSAPAEVHGHESRQVRPRPRLRHQLRPGPRRRYRQRRRGRHGHLRLPERRGGHSPRPEGRAPGPSEPGRLDPGHREGRARGPGRSGEKGQGLRSRVRRRHRRRYDRLDSPARRPRRKAPGPLQGIQEEPQRPGLALEGPHRIRRGRRDHGPRRRRAPRVPGQVRRDLLLRMVLEQDPPLPADRPEGRRGRLLVGRVRRPHPRPPHRDRPTRCG